VLTQLNYDMIVTSALSTYAPHQDPNAIFIVDWWIFFGNDSVEFLRTGSGEVAGLLMLAGGYPGGGGYSASVQPAGYGFNMAWDETLLWPEIMWSESKSWGLEYSPTGRYAGITTYS